MSIRGASISAAVVTLVALLVSTPAARALTITLDLEKLKDRHGGAFPVGGLIVLTAGTSGTFSGPTAESFASGDELVLQKWDLSAFSMPGIFSDVTTDLTLGGSWNAGDPLRIYWYPTLTLASSAPGEDTPFGAYRDAVGLDGSATWITPSSGSTIALKFFTDDSIFLASGGSNPAAAGVASLQVVPEPNAMLLGVFGAAWLGLRRARRR